MSGNSKIETVQKLGYFKQINYFQCGRGGFKIFCSTWLNICFQELRKQWAKMYFLFRILKIANTWPPSLAHSAECSVCGGGDCLKHTQLYLIWAAVSALNLILISLSSDFVIVSTFSVSWPCKSHLTTVTSSSVSPAWLSLHSWWTDRRPCKEGQQHRRHLQLQ